MATTIFFNKIKANWNHNKIIAIENNYGELVFDQSQVSFVSIDFFKNSIGSVDNLQQCDLSDVVCPTISEAHDRIFEDPINASLIFDTIKAMKQNKAPGPNGFTMEFYLATLDIGLSDFCKAIVHFFNTFSMFKGINSTSISLIP